VELRYGLNPHQAARMTGDTKPPFTVLNGTPSFINVLDALGAWQLVREASAALGVPAAASFKHTSPAGAAIAGGIDSTMRASWGLRRAETGPLTSAYVRARDCDPKSSFGDMIAVSQPVDAELAAFVCGVIADGIIAPGFEPGTVELLARKKRRAFCVLEADPGYEPPAWERREVYGVVLEQERDRQPITAACLQGPQLPEAAVRDALLGMITLRYTQSNSVAFVRDGMTLGVAAGQQSRVDCTRLAGEKAAIWSRRRHPAAREPAFAPRLPRQERLNGQMRRASDPSLPSGLDGVTMVSDGFLPFSDNVDVASEYGVSYIVEPGGSTRSEDVRAACRSHGITLTRTGIRLFRH
jgi:phosphoribosylaminoimidazolecarboxamide formyltransferase / IMP cyclohydrolase